MREPRSGPGGSWAGVSAAMAQFFSSRHPMPIGIWDDGTSHGIPLDIGMMLYTPRPGLLCAPTLTYARNIPLFNGMKSCSRVPATWAFASTNVPSSHGTFRG